MSDPHLDDILQHGDAAALGIAIGELNSGDVSRALSDLSSTDRLELVNRLDSEDAAHLLERLPETQAAQLVMELEPERLGALVSELPSDQQADVCHDLSPERRDAVLAVLERVDPEEAAEVRFLSAYDPHVAGGLMATEVLTFPSEWTVAQVIADMRANAEVYADYEVQYAYAVEEGVLAGVLRLRDLLLAPSAQLVSSLLIPDTVSVRDDAPLEELAELFHRCRFLGVPVLDAEGKVLGVLRRSSVEEALGARADRDYLSAQGIVGGEELRSMPLLLRARRRLSWLGLNVLLNVAAASVIAFYQDTLTQVIALAVFLPIISDMSGCSGSQAVAVSVRELALGTVRPHELWRVLVKEAGVGLINGVVLGLLLALVAWLWKANPWLGGVVGVALCVNTLVSVLIGGTVPLVLKRLGRDPALASGPVLTTITDICGFLLVLGLATLALPHLVG